MTDLIGHLYESVLTDDSLDTFISRLNLKLRAKTTCLIVDIHREDKDHVFLLHGGNEETVERYRSVMYAYDPFVNLPSHKVVLIEELVDMDQWRKSEFYRFCIEPSGLYYFLGIDIPVGDDITIRLRIGRSKEDGNFKKDEKEICHALASHISRAYRIKKKIGYSSKEIDIYRETFDKLSVGVVILSPSGEVSSANSKGRAILNRKGKIYLENEVLKFSNAAERKCFERACYEIIELSKGGKAQIAKAISVKGKRPGSRLTFTIKPSILHADKMTVKSPPELIIFINDHDVNLDTNVGILTDIFGLTKAESKLSLLLANGHTINEAAEMLDIKLNTAKAHLRSIFNKMQINRQSQLVSEILRNTANLVS